MINDDEEDPIADAQQAQNRIIADALSREKVIKKIQSTNRRQVEGRNRTNSMDSTEAESSFDEGEVKDEMTVFPITPGLDIREVLFEAIPEVRNYLSLIHFLIHLLLFFSHIHIPLSFNACIYQKSTNQLIEIYTMLV